MTLLYTDPIFLEHETGRHPERAERLRQVTRHLERVGLDRECDCRKAEPIGPEPLGWIHTPEYAARLKAFAKAGGGRIEADTLVSPRSYDVALAAAGAVRDAVSQVLAGKDRNALCLVRPPGHHALAEDAMGFCLFNNVAIGAKSAILESQLDRVLIVDWDVHHGNGTQDAFWTDEKVAFLSIHRWPFYPGTGDEDETGSGPGLGTVKNLPVKFGTPRNEYLKRFTTELDSFAGRFQPQLILVSAGFDSHRDDPIGSLGLETEDFEPLTDAVLDVADTYAGGRLVSVLEGGYNAGVLAGCVETHLRRILARSAQA
jgi:acetoin utilization deacetylase AcuC-like enzyme